MSLVLLVVCLAACTGPQNMDDQPKFETYEAAARFPQNQSALPLVPGTVARNQDRPAAAPVPVTLALLVRGRERYDIFCSPCHGLAGYGDGMIVRRGFPSPPSYHDERLRAAPDSHFYDVITHGYGVMYSYAARVPPPDRWAIVGYIRALQLSQHAAAADLPDDLRAGLEAAQ